MTTLRVDDLRDYLITAVKGGRESAVDYLCYAAITYFSEKGQMVINPPEYDIVYRLGIWLGRFIESGVYGIDSSFTHDELDTYFKRGYKVVYGDKPIPTRDFIDPNLSFYRILNRIGMLDHVLYMHPDAEFVFG